MNSATKSARQTILETAQSIVGGCRENGNRLWRMSEILADLTLCEFAQAPNIPSTH